MSESKRAFAVVRLADQWYVACRSTDLRRRPLARTILDEPLVLFRDGEGRPTALLDRCAHRNLPLSQGRVVDGLLECAYHGWRYGRDGACGLVPGLVGPDEDGKGRVVPTRPVREEQGAVWVYAGTGPLRGEPFRFPHLEDPRYTTVTADMRVNATLLHSVISFRLPLPGPLVRALVSPVARRIMAQDARILRLQTETVRRFGEERYVSTALDLLGPHIWRLLKEAEAGHRETVSGEPAVEKRVQLII